MAGGARGGATVAIVDALGVGYVHDDHLGTPQVMTDGLAAMVWDASYRPFGEAVTTGALTFNLRFPGQYYDGETALHYNNMRDYDPATGRYVQSDPISLVGGWNTYAYAGGNPVVRFDPTGLTYEQIAILGGLAQYHEPDLNFPDDFLYLKREEFMDMYNLPEDVVTDAAGAYTPNPIDRIAIFEEVYPRDRELNCDELKKCYRTYVHEVIHRTEYLHNRVWENHHPGDWIYTEANNRMLAREDVIEAAFPEECPYGCEEGE